MPSHETCFEQQFRNRRIEVLKTYDQAYAHQAFQNMDVEAMQRLWASLKPKKLTTRVNETTGSRSESL